MRFWHDYWVSFWSGANVLHRAVGSHSGARGHLSPTICTISFAVEQRTLFEKFLFLSDGGASKCRGPRKLPLLLSPLDGPGFAYGPADATATLSSLASLKSRMVLPFWCRLKPTQVVLEKRPLNGYDASTRESVIISHILGVFNESRLTGQLTNETDYAMSQWYLKWSHRQWTYFDAVCAVL